MDGTIQVFIIRLDESYSNWSSGFTREQVLKVVVVFELPVEIQCPKSRNEED